MLRRGGTAGHMQDRATSHRSCLAPLASHPTPRPLCPVCSTFKDIELVEEAYVLKGREQHDEWAEGRRYLGLDVLARAQALGTTTEKVTAE